MRSIWAALIMVMGLAVVSGPADAQPTKSDKALRTVQPLSPCTKDANVDSCWRAGVRAEERGNAEAALAAYDASCAAGFQVGGCYEAGKIYFLNAKLRDYGKSKQKMERVCESTDVGIAPYACKYLGIIYQKGLSVAPRPDRAFSYFAKACFPRGEPFIDGNGCELLGNNVPDADAAGVPEEDWRPEYIAYLAFAMGCSDNMPAQCNRAQAIHQRAVKRSANWLARCAEDAKTVQFRARCEDMPRLASVEEYDARQSFRLSVVRMFRLAADYVE
ncbi:SEL1-like repeat protein [Tsuneonella flava]|uniref:SEL1-like repeat protein n=1 Tax=Tsuneonella flava TaxID=2055955 RepID=UPI000F4C9AC7|nr:SEL1-like repeat protein [Tsuneonella flava]